MSAASSAQLNNVARELREKTTEASMLRHELDDLRKKLGRAHQICLDHATCDCSAAVMILDVIGEK